MGNRRREEKKRRFICDTSYWAKRLRVSEAALKPVQTLRFVGKYRW
jgi:hypothetical protein